MTRVYLETFGCTLNKFDSDVMEAYLVENGYELTEDISKSDIIVINTCGVKKQTEDKMVSYIRHLNSHYPDKRIILTGCLTLINKRRLVEECKFDALLGPSAGKRIIDAVESVLNGEFYENLDSDGPDSSVRILGGVSKPIGVSTGCLDNCAFCGTRNARGLVKSMAPEKVVELARKYIESGVKEILLTSTDMGAYGFDLRPRVPLPRLLKMLDELKGDFIIRIGMMNPRWAYMYLDELIEILSESRHFYRFLHIPVQTGSSRLLKIMDRGHGVDEYLEVVKRVRKEIGEEFSIMTDIIVGHPGERDDDFALTLEVLEESKPDFVNISQFFPRPGTKAALMKKVDTRIVKSRSREVSKLCDEILYARNLMWRGWKGPILINDFGRGRFLGRNYAYKIVAVDGNIGLGSWVNVEILRAYTTWLYGEVLGRSSSLFESYVQSEA